jgi:hypothetical protein
MLEIFLQGAKGGRGGRGGRGLGLAYATGEQVLPGDDAQVDKGCKKGDIRPCIKKGLPETAPFLYPPVKN